MATNPDTPAPDPNPDSVPQEAPSARPDEINPGQGGDMDIPDVAPSEQPGSPGINDGNRGGG